MASDRSFSRRARHLSRRLAQAGSAAVLALMAVTCHSDSGTPPCTVTSLKFTNQPASTAAGAPITASVAAVDGSGNTVTCFSGSVTIALGANPGGATLGGATTITAASGVANFTLTITKAANGYTLAASTGGAGGVTSNAFNVTPASASTLTFTTQPATSAAGAAFTAVVTATDQFGNTAAGFTGAVAMTIGTNPASGTLSGTTTKTAVAGVATFSNLSIDRVGTGYKLTATTTAPALNTTSNAFNINPGPPAKLVFTQQPTSDSAGSPIDPTITVTAQDAQGNTTPSFTGKVALAIGTNPGGGALTGGDSVAAVNGVASFPAASIDKPGTGYTLTAGAAGLTGATSDPFDIATGPLAQLVFTVEPSDALAGVAIAPGVQVTAQDAAGNTVTTFTGNVTVAIGTNPGSGTLSGNLTKAAVGGVVTFTSLSIDKAGAGYTLTATSGGAPQIASAPFNITPAAAAKLSFSAAGAQQPTNTAAGTAIAPAVKVAALDQFDNLDTNFSGNVTVAIGTNPKAGTLSGTTAIAAAKGIATFSTLSIDSAAPGYTLTATASGLTDGTSATFDIGAGAATHLAFFQQPTSDTAGVTIAPAVTVRALDAQGNVATGYTANVTLAIGNNAGSGTLTGGGPSAAVAGVATFSGLSIDKSGTGYTLTAASGALTGATSAAFDIIAGTATRLVFQVQPVNTAAGAAIAPSVQVAAQDALGNTDLTYSADVTLDFATNPGSGTLTGAGPVAAANGVATFPALSIDKVGTGYTLTATSGSLTAVTSQTFDIFANTATHLVFSVAPSNAVAGVAIAPAVVVQALDNSNNVATGFAGGVTIAIGTNAGGGTLSGTASVPAVSGVATFSNLSINKTGDGYTLTATAGGVTGVTSSGFAITPAAATHLFFAQQPTETVAGASIAPAVVVQALDAFDNVDTAYTGAVDVAIGTNPGSGTLSGTTPVAAVHGVASFADLSIDRSGVGYTLHATSGTLTDVTSGQFNITAGALTKLVFGQGPSNVIAGAVIQPDVTVQGEDALGNLVTGFTGNITVAIATNPGSGTLGGTTTVAAAGGVATFSNLSIDKAGSGYTLTATNAGATPATSNTFDVTPGTATKLVFTVQPAASTTAGTVISSTVTVAAQDAQGNTDPTFAGDIALALAGGTAGAHLSGTTTITAASGVAVFSNLSVDSAGTGYTLVASSGSLTDGTSSPFAITAGTATKLAFTVNPVATTAGQAIPTIQVNAQDALGNTVPGYVSSVSVAITGGTGKTGAALSGTASQNAVAGVASFSALSIDSAGTAYTLTATSGSLTNAVSAAFDINAGPVTQLLFTQQPSNAQAGNAISPAVTLVAKDAIGNINTAYTQTVTLTLPVNPGSATPNNASLAAVAGVASFPGLFLDKVGTGYRLEASDGSVTSAQSNTFNITPGAASQLVFVQQPSNVTVGANIFPAVQVAAQDAFGNTVTSFANNVVMSIVNNVGGAVLGGSLTKAAISGVATFSTLDLSAAGNGYTLGAAASGLSSATSLPFNVLPSTAQALFFKIQPSRTTAGQTIASFTVEARDASGQLVTGYTDNVTIAVTTNTGAPGATLGGTTTQAAVGGTATFNDIVLDKAADNYKFTASAASVTDAVSGFFAIDPAAADHLVYTVQPSNATAAQVITPQIEVTALDAFGNVATAFTDDVTMSISDANASLGVLSGTTTKAAAAGVATFNDLSINIAQTAHTLDATDAGGAGAGSVTSNPFDITVSTSSHLAFKTQPQSATAGQAIPTFTIVALDAANDTLIGFNGDVTVSITAGTGTGGATLSGTTTVTAVNGFATFSGLSIDKKGTGYRLSAVASGLAGTTSTTFTISAGAATQVAFIVDPTSTSAGTPISPAVQVDVEDAFGNRVTTFSGDMTLAFSTNAGGGTLSGTLTQPVASGIATFSDLSIDAAGSGYRLAASSAGLTGDVSQAFNITGGAADHLVFTVSPSDAVAGAGISPDVRVTAFDAFGNVATGFADNVTIAITGGTGTPGATLSGVTTLPAVAGVATFTGLSVDKAGSGYTLSATSTVTGATSGTFTISPAAATQLIFSVQPSNTAAGATITPAVVVTAVDQFGNTATSYAGSVTVAIGTNAGGGGTTLSGTKIQTAVGGLATFSDLSINNAGTGYTLTAVGSSPALPLVTSSTFNIQ